MTTINTESGKVIELPITADECLATARAVLARQKVYLDGISANYKELQLRELAITACAFSVMQSHYGNRTKFPHGVKKAIIAICGEAGLSTSVATRNVTWAAHFLKGGVMETPELVDAAKNEKPMSLVAALKKMGLDEVGKVGEAVKAALAASGKVPKAKPVPTSAQRIARAIRSVDAEQPKAWRVLRDAIIEAGGEPLLANLIRNCTKAKPSAKAEA